MDLLDVLAYKNRMMYEHGVAREELDAWWESMPDMLVLTKEDLEPLYRSQQWSLLVGENREAADCAHMRWRQRSIRGWLGDKLRRRFRLR